MSRSRKIISWLRDTIPHHQVESNMTKDLIPEKLARLSGSILLVTSRYEGFSLSLVEGMSQGLIPVSFAVGVAKEIIEDGVNGYIVSSIYEAETIISKLLADTELRRELSKNARKTAENFRSDILVRKMIELYERIRKK